MNTPTKPDYEQLKSLALRMWQEIKENGSSDWEPLPHMPGLIAQVDNMFAGMRDRLAQLEWVPVTERLPERDDADEFEDVEWSDGKCIWQCSYKTGAEKRKWGTYTATHWRRITLP